MKKIFLSAILAGAVIAFGGTVFLSVENTVVGSLFFHNRSFVVCTRGLHLFTGKVCYVFDNDIGLRQNAAGHLAGELTGTFAHRARREVHAACIPQRPCAGHL